MRCENEGGKSLGNVTLSVETFRMGTDKEAALKPLEEAAEVYGAWQLYEKAVSRGEVDLERYRVDLMDEIADCIQACCNMAARVRENDRSCDVGLAMKRCHDRNAKRGRF